MSSALYRHLAGPWSSDVNEMKHGNAMIFRRDEASHEGAATQLRQHVYGSNSVHHHKKYQDCQSDKLFATADDVRLEALGRLRCGG